MYYVCSICIFFSSRISAVYRDQHEPRRLAIRCDLRDRGSHKIFHVTHFQWRLALSSSWCSHSSLHIRGKKTRVLDTFSLFFLCRRRANEKEDFRFYSEDCEAEIEQWLHFTFYAECSLPWFFDFWSRPVATLLRILSRNLFTRHMESEVDIPRLPIGENIRPTLSAVIWKHRAHRTWDTIGKVNYSLMTAVGQTWCQSGFTISKHIAFHTCSQPTTDFHSLRALYGFKLALLFFPHLNPRVCLNLIWFPPKKKLTATPEERAPAQSGQNSWRRLWWWLQSHRSQKVFPFVATVQSIHSSDGEWSKNICQRREATRWVNVNNVWSVLGGATHRFRVGRIADMQLGVADDARRCGLHIHRVCLFGSKIRYLQLKSEKQADR